VLQTKQVPEVKTPDFNEFGFSVAVSKDFFVASSKYSNVALDNNAYGACYAYGTRRPRRQWGKAKESRDREANHFPLHSNSNNSSNKKELRAKAVTGNPAKRRQRAGSQLTMPTTKSFNANCLMMGTQSET